MRRTKRKNVFLSTFFSKLICFVLILALAGAAKVSFDKYLIWKEAREVLASKQEAIKQEKEKIEGFKKFLDYFQNQEYLERMVKEKLNLVRPGEKIIYVLPPKVETEKEESKESGGIKTFFEKLKEIFLKMDKADNSD